MGKDWVGKDKVEGGREGDGGEVGDGDGERKDVHGVGWDGDGDKHREKHW